MSRRSPCPTGAPLVVNGRLNHRALRREFISKDELSSALRQHGVTDISQVRRAYLEPDGALSIIPVDQDDSGSSAASS